MKRGDVIIAALPGDYAKPRPALIVQADAFAALESVIVCPMTSDVETGGILRVLVEPDDDNGLRKPSLVMVEKINAISHGRCRQTIGRLNPDRMAAVDLALRLILFAE